MGINDNLVASNWHEFILIISNLSHSSSHRLWFRGQRDYDWKLLPSIRRDVYNRPGVEQYMATNFMVETRRRMQNTPNTYERASWLELMQHYGLPTKLLDWSASPLIALYFALFKESETDSALWILDPQALNRQMQMGPYLFPMDYQTIRPFLEGAFDVNKDYRSEKIIACNGIGHDLRMYVQQSSFTVHDTKQLALDELLETGNFLWKIRIPNDCRAFFLETLQMMGIHESTIFPDMEHIAEEQRIRFAKDSLI